MCQGQSYRLQMRQLPVLPTSRGDRKTCFLPCYSDLGIYGIATLPLSLLPSPRTNPATLHAPAACFPPRPSSSQTDPRSLCQNGKPQRRNPLLQSCNRSNNPGLFSPSAFFPFHLVSSASCTHRKTAVNPVNCWPSLETRCVPSSLMPCHAMGPLPDLPPHIDHYRP